jgi:hypothetical protein
MFRHIFLRLPLDRSPYGNTAPGEPRDLHLPGAACKQPGQWHVFHGRKRIDAVIE